MRDYRLQLLFRKPGQSGNRQEYNGPEPSDHRRRLQPSTLAVGNRAIDVEPSLQCAANFEDSRIHCRRLSAALAFNQQKSPGSPQTEASNADQPRLYQPRQGVERLCRWRSCRSRSHSRAARRGLFRHNLLRSGPGYRGWRRRLPGICPAGTVLRVKNKCCQRRQQHQDERRDSNRITHRSTPANRHCSSGHGSDRRSLPQEMQQRPCQ